MAWKDLSKLQKVGIVVGGIFILGSISSAATSNQTTSTPASNETTSAPTDSSAPEQPQVETSPKIGDEVRDGRFAFRVLSFQCGQTEIGSPYFSETASGHFCQMELEVKNIKDAPQTFFSSNQFAYNDQGHKYSNDSSAELLIDDNSDIWLEEINPGNSIKGIVVFDVPKDATITKVELHDSAFSGGVEVLLQ